MNTPTENSALLSDGETAPPVPTEYAPVVSAEQEHSEIEDAISRDDVVKDEPALDGVVNIEFLDLAMEPISDLKYRFEIEGKRISGITDAKGHTERLTDIVAGTLIDVYVFRDHLKDYKKVGTICGNGGECGYSIVSPKLRFALDTEKHEGAPGNAEENKPPIPPVIVSEAQAASAQPPTAKTVPATAPAGLPPAKPPVSGASTAAKPAAAKLEVGRDSKGNPLVTVKPTVVDSVYKSVMPFLHLWGWWSTGYVAKPGSAQTKVSTTEAKSSVPSKPSKKPIDIEKNKKAATKTTTVPAQAINPAVKITQSKGVALSVENKKYLDALISYAEAQVLINYEGYKGGGVTRKILKAVNSHPPILSPAKEASDTKGMCFAYVRAALHQTRLVNHDSGSELAKNAGIDLGIENYLDVTTTLPQVTINYPSAHSAKQQPKVVGINAKRSAVTTQAKNEKWKNSKKQEALAKIDGYPEPEGIDISQADLMYTLPGDIIVYKQVVPHDPNAAGHIDIRTYHGFMSDFVWSTTPKLGGQKFKGKQYAVIGVYRKLSDEMAMVRVRAFLRIIREHEAKGFSEPYQALKWEGRKQISFSDLSTHPSNREKNEPAGAYQIKWSTWDDVTRKLIGWPPNFVPETQERIALYLLQRRPNKDMPHPRRSALGYIMEGRIEDAVNQTGLPNEWSFLPGGKGQQIDMNKLKALFDQYVQGHVK